MRYSSSAHTRFYHRFHVVWVTKYRYPVLQGPMRDRVRQIIRQTCDEMGVHIVRDVLARDYVQMFLSIPPKLGLSELAAATLRDTRRGKNTIHRLDGFFRQSVFGRLAGSRNSHVDHLVKLKFTLGQVG